jgi:hypothetical protein
MENFNVTVICIKYSLQRLVKYTNVFRVHLLPLILPTCTVLDKTLKLMFYSELSIPNVKSFSSCLQFIKETSLRFNDMIRQEFLVYKISDAFRSFRFSRIIIINIIIYCENWLENNPSVFPE